MTKKHEEDYQIIAHILLNNNQARKDNRVLLKNYYLVKGFESIDEAFADSEVLNYQTVDRIARRLKATNKQLQYDKSEQVDIYKQIGLDIPVVTRVY